jgi:Cys-tRNA(Pro) deacylase
MAKEKFPVTTAIRTLRQQKVDFGSHLYSYEEKGGTTVSARELGVDEHAVIKTLIMEDETKTACIVLMHGDRQVSTKQLARAAGCKSIHPCTPEIALRHTGYQIGGTSPFGARTKMKVYAEESIFDLPMIYINGGKRGYLVSMPPAELKRLLNPVKVQVAINGSGT